MTFTNREPNENANRKINKRSFVPIQTIQNYFETKNLTYKVHLNKIQLKQVLQEHQLVYS